MPLNNKQIASALVTIAKLDSSNPAHVEAATTLMLHVMPGLTNKLLSNVEVSSGLTTDRYLVEALTDALDEITDETTNDFDIENDNVGDKEEEEEANDSMIADIASESEMIEKLLNNAKGYLSL